MSTAPDAATRAAGRRWWAAVEAAQATYDALATDPTWTPSKVQTEHRAASDLARMYDALSNELTGPLAIALRHARNHLDHQVAELDTRLSEDFLDADFDDHSLGTERATTRADHPPAPLGGSTMDTTELGQGVLGWPAEERHSDRYGLIHLNAIPDTANFTPLPFDTALAGAHGRLVAVVLDTRPSPHIGDMARAVGPAMPTVGEEITLGTGTLFVVPWRWGFSLVGVKPDKDRSHDWMDPVALFRCHHQTVRLELRHDATSVINGRCFGSSYSDTAGLDLPQLAVRLMAELVTRAADPDSGLPAHAYYSAAVNPPRRTIVLAVFGLTDEEIYDHSDAPAGSVITHHAQPIIDAHNWTNPGDPNDYRFSTTIVAFDQAGQSRLVDRGRGPDTVCVITTDRDGWWHA